MGKGRSSWIYRLMFVCSTSTNLNSPSKAQFCCLSGFSYQVFRRFSRDLPEAPPCTMPGLDFSVTGSATVLQPRPPPSGAAKQVNIAKPGRTLLNPATTPTSRPAAQPTQLSGPALTEIVSSKILERFTAFSEAFIPFDVNHTGAVSYTHLTLPTICSV